jgi:hypothetical protein
MDTGNELYKNIENFNPQSNKYLTNLKSPSSSDQRSNLLNPNYHKSHLSELEQIKVIINSVINSCRIDIEGLQAWKQRVETEVNKTNK